MKFSIQDLKELIKETLQEKQWNKNSKTPRNYDEEYNPPGSKEQEERNKRKRDKRKHDKENGECPEGEELHHTSGIENDDVECEPVSKNRGRKGEGARTSKDLKVKITKSSLEEIVKEETVTVVNEIFGSLAGMALAKGGKWVAGKAMDKAFDAAKEFVVDTGSEKAAAAKIKDMKPKSFKEAGAIINALIQHIADEGGVEGEPAELESALAASAPYMAMLKKQAGGR